MFLFDDDDAAITHVLAQIFSKTKFKALCVRELHEVRCPCHIMFDFSIWEENAAHSFLLTEANSFVNKAAILSIKEEVSSVDNSHYPIDTFSPLPLSLFSY